MAYFTKNFTAFFRGLERNNNKDWFDANRKTYEKQVRDPFKVLVKDMIALIAKEEPGLNVAPKNCMFRINRDLRFSKDKTPYNPWLSAFISPIGKDGNVPGFYFRGHAKGLMIGGGIYQPDKANLQRIRSEIAYCQDEFSSILNNTEFKSRFGELQGEQHKVIPAEFKEDAVRQPLIANKQFFYRTELKPAVLTQEKLPAVLMDHYHAAKPLSDFLKRALFTE